jgi:hypothetical protein
MCDIAIEVVIRYVFAKNITIIAVLVAAKHSSSRLVIVATYVILIYSVLRFFHSCLYVYY